MGLISRKWVRRLGIGTAAVLLTLGLAMEFWIIPSMARSRLSSVMADYWSGSASVDGVDYHFFGPMRLRGLKLSDDTGRCWVAVDTLEVSGRDFAADKPVITDISAHGVTVNLHYADGRLVSPFKVAAEVPGRAPLAQLALHRLELADVSVVGYNAGQSYALADGVALVATPSGRGWQFDLSGRCCRYFQTLQLGGQLDFSDDGLAATVREASLRTAGGAEIATFEADMGLGPDVLILRRFQGRLAGGDIIAHGHARWDHATGGLTYDATAAVLRMDLSRASAVMAGPDRRTAGIASGGVSLCGRSWRLGDLRGQGQVAIVGSDVTTAAVVKRILQNVGMKSGDGMKHFDIDARFTLLGPVAIVDQAKMANKVSSFSLAPGGSCNMQTGAMDLKFAALNLEEMKNGSPWSLTGLTASAIEKLTLMRLRCRWDDPASVQIGPAFASVGDDATLCAMLADAADQLPPPPQTLDEITAAIVASGCACSQSAGGPCTQPSVARIPGE